jgi:predicted nucleic acid-binding protein
VIILDTNVLSELMKSRPDPSVKRWTEEQALGNLFTTSVTKAEILYGIELLPQGKRREGLVAMAESIFEVGFAGRVLAFEDETARPFATIAADRRSKGRPISDLDAQIAAIVRTHKATLATRNRSDFENCGIELVDPWHAETLTRRTR